MDLLIFTTNYHHFNYHHSYQTDILNSCSRYTVLSFRNITDTDDKADNYFVVEDATLVITDLYERSVTHRAVNKLLSFEKKTFPFSNSVFLPPNFSRQSVNFRTPNVIYGC